jgi:hypothetical protein
MNWKLIALLSLFGLGMGIATVSWVPSTVEPFVWVPILGFCAYLIAMRGGPRHFLQGVALGLANSVWVTGAHVLFLDSYLAHHAREAAMAASAPLAPRVLMLLTGPVIGLASGILIGLLSLGFARLAR